MPWSHTLLVKILSLLLYNGKNQLDHEPVTFLLLSLPKLKNKQKKTDNSESTNHKKRQFSPCELQIPSNFRKGNFGLTSEPSKLFYFLFSANFFSLSGSRRIRVKVWDISNLIIYTDNKITHFKLKQTRINWYAQWTMEP